MYQNENSNQFDNQNAEKLYRRLKEINQDKAKEKFLDSIRFQDNDISRKANAILNVSGIFVAGSLIQGEILKSFNQVLPLYIIGLVCLFIGIWLSVSILIKTEKKYSENACQALEEYYIYIENKQKKLKPMYYSSLTGGFFIIMGFFCYIYLS